jgi:hypothetical protein
MELGIHFLPQADHIWRRSVQFGGNLALGKECEKIGKKCQKKRKSWENMREKMAKDEKNWGKDGNKRKYILKTMGKILKWKTMEQ